MTRDPFTGLTQTERAAADQKASLYVHQLPDGQWTIGQRGDGCWYLPMTGDERQATGAREYYAATLERLSAPRFANRADAIRAAERRFGSFAPYRWQEQ